MFVCTKCGVCCKNIDKIPELADFDLGNGICKYLTKENTCAIYLTRPDICSVEKMYEKKYKNFYSKDEYEKLNPDACKILQKNFKIK